MGNGGTSEAAQAAAIVSEAVQVGLNQLQHVYELVSDADTTWDAETIKNEASDAIDRATPVITESINLALSLLRPWSKAFSERTQ